jgi:AAA domain
MDSHKYSTQVERLEVVETGRRRRWSDDEKLRIVIESLQTPRLVVNGEDSTEEIWRRGYAFCLAHGIAERDLHGLTAVGADDVWVQRISFLTTNERGLSALNQGGLDALQLALDALHPDVIVIDPLVSFCAGGNMNDNAVMSSVMRKLKEIAARYECAVLIVHHTRKGGEIFAVAFTPCGSVRRVCARTWRRGELVRARFVTGTELRSARKANPPSAVVAS